MFILSHRPICIALQIFERILYETLSHLIHEYIYQTVILRKKLKYIVVKLYHFVYNLSVFLKYFIFNIICVYFYKTTYRIL